jgi:protocatechuate 3,4-dioxygenase beta subunit
MRALGTFGVLIALAAAAAGDLLFGQAGAPPGRPGESAATGGAVIVGRVVDAASGQPIAGAIVTAGGAGQFVLGNAAATAELVAVGVLPQSMAPADVAMTDARGVFVFRDLASGRTTLTVRAAGYLPGAYGQRRPEGSTRSLLITPGETLADVELRLWKTGAISGTILDELGEPVVEVGVRALRRTMVRGRPTFALAGSGASDDRGIYRIGSLVPGEYVVVMPSSVTSIPVSVADSYLSAAGGSDPASRSFVSDVSRAGTAAASGGVTVGDQRVQTDYGRALAPTPRTPEEFAVYPIVFHPSAYTPQQAALVSVGSGEERSGVHLRTGLVRTYRISGSVIGPDGPAPNVNVRLVPAFTRELSTDSGFIASTTSTDAEGRFTIIGATPGDYVIRAQRVGASLGGSATVVRAGDGTFMVIGGEGASMSPGASPPGSETLTGTAAVSVGDTDLSGVSVTLQGGARIAGRLEFTGSSSKPGPADLSRAGVSVTRVDGASVPAQQTRATPQGTFNTPPYPHGDYHLGVVVVPPGWYLRSILVSGREVLDRSIPLSEDLDGVVIRFVDRLGELSGRVGRTGIGAREDAAARVALFPADYQEWMASGMSPRRTRLVDAAADGTFEMPTLVPGDYLVAAVEADTAVELQDPRDIEALARGATRVTIGEAEQRSVTLSVSRLR